MTLRPRLVPREQVFGSADSPPEQLIADYLRHFLCHLGPASQPGTFTPHPVHAAALRAAVLRQLGELADDAPGAPWPDDDLGRSRQELDLPDLFSLELHKLAVLGEAAHAGGGYYLPTPPRLIEFPDGMTLAVGGLPTWALARRLGDIRPTAGLGRVVTRAAPGDVPRHPAAEWLDPPSAGEPGTAVRDTDGWRVAVPRSFPLAGMRLLYALAREELVEGRPPVLRFTAPDVAWGAIEPALRSLGVSVNGDGPGAVLV